MTPQEKAKELRSQFGDNAKYVSLEILDTLKRMPIGYESAEREYLYWQSVKKELETLKN